jgi:acyl carrier protein
MTHHPRHERVVEAIFVAVDELNQQLRRSQRLAKSLDTRITGDGSLDSLGLLNLIVLVEEKVDQAFGIAVTLTDDQVLAGQADAFHTLGSLTDFVHRAVAAKMKG